MTLKSVARRGTVVVLGPVIAASLMTASPTMANAVGGAPGVPDAESVGVSEVPDGADLPDVDAQPAKTDRSEKPTWPTAGDTVDVPVEAESESDSEATPTEPRATTDDPMTAPESVVVESLGQLPEGGVAGFGVAYSVSVPPVDEEPTPGSDDSQDAGEQAEVDSPALFQPAIFGQFRLQTPDPSPSPEPSDETPSPSPTTPTPTPTEPEAPEAPEPGELLGPSAPEFLADVEVELSYEAFATAFGGDWASRLRAVQLDECTTINGQLDCSTATPMESTNDTENQTVTVTVPAQAYSSNDATAGETPDPDAPEVDGDLGAPDESQDDAGQIGDFLPVASVTPIATSPGSSAIALTAGAGGEKGDFAASPMGLSSSWNAGSGSGEFNWTYPFNVTAPSAGPSPDLALSYSSGSVDGRTGSSNNQTSRIGEGFELDPGFIERTYIPCGDDTGNGAGNEPTNGTDLCWSDRNLTISLGGKSSKLIVDSADGKYWRMKTDDGTNISRVSGNPTQNKAYDGEYWVAETPDGTTYYFGLNKRYVGDTQPTDSVSTVRVYGNNSGEPCHEIPFADSGCIQGWRWGLDYVVDRDGNTMTYDYEQEDNWYGANKGTVRSLYNRGARLTSVSYGNNKTRDKAGKPAPYRVELGKDGRCEAPDSAGNCSINNLDTARAYQWPDVPYDQLCYSTTSKCPEAPSFFTLYRTSSVASLVRNADNSAYQTVQEWDLNHYFPRTGDTTEKTLFLNRISHTAGNVVLPTTYLTGTQLPNRVDTTGDSIAPFIKSRLASIKNGVGGVTSINYNTQDSAYACSWADKPSDAAPYNNNKLCYASSYQPSFSEDPKTEYFHKYVVDSVVESDQIGNAPNVVTKYTYKGGVAWHYDESNLTTFSKRTWNDWRGFSKVLTEVGGAGKRTYSESLYMRGMSGDRGPNGTKRTFMVDDIASDGSTISPSIEDKDGLAGYERRVTTAQGAGGPQTSMTVNTPWLSQETAAANSQRAYYLGTAVTETTTNRSASAGGNLTTRVNTTFDTAGRPVAVYDDGNIVNTGAGGDIDGICTKTTYVDVTSPSISNLVATEQSNEGNCTAAVNGDNVIDSVRNYYGTSTTGTTDTAQKLTKTETLGVAEGNSAWDSAWVTEAQMTYDSSGRPTSTTDAAGNTTTTAYTVGGDDGLSGNRILSEVKTTNAAGQVSTSKVNFKWGTPTQTTDVAGLTTTLEYDQAGRVLTAWSPGRFSAATNAVPDARFTYVSDLNGTRVTTDVLNSLGQTTRSQVFYDGLMRERQTQSTAAGPDGGRLITESLYDSRGWLDSKRGPYFNETAVSENPSTGTLVRASAASIPSYTNYDYDGLGRATKTSLMSFGKKVSDTDTTYDGTRTIVEPPAGATATTTNTDARGRTVSVKQHHGSTANASVDETNYTYTVDGQLAKVLSSDSADPALRTVWEYVYDVRGRQISADDPDKGVTTTTYDDMDRAVSITDANEHTLWTTYDKLGRKTELRDSSADGRERASWTYAASGPGTGQIEKSTRYDDFNDDGTDDQFATSYTYDNRGRPQTSTLVLPENVGLDAFRPAGGYVTTMTYYDDGSPKQILQPTTTGTGVTNEALSYTYDKLGNLDTLTGAGAIVAGSTYTPLGQLAQRVLGPTVGKAVYENREYADATSRLTRQAVALQTDASSTQLDQRYGYDDAGNVTSLDDLPTAAGTTRLRQCFTYDYLQRLTEARSSASTSCATPDAPELGSTSPYLDSYEYSLSGNRTNWTETRGTATSVHNSTYPSPVEDRPHALTSVASSGAAPQTEEFTYDAAGSLIERSGGEVGDQTIVWDREGHQKSVSDTAGNTKYTYDADGSRLIKRDQASDSTTLYLGSSEYALIGTTKSLVRNYSADGQSVAVRDANGLSVVVADRNNTGQLTVGQDSTQASRRRFTPFGEELVAPTTEWPGSRGYLDKTIDASTGTTHLDAREYDTRLGRFLSVDPILDPLDPQQANGYAYAANNPITRADPTGLYIPCEGHHCAVAGGGGVYLPGNDAWRARADQNLTRSYFVKQPTVNDRGSKKNALRVMGGAQGLGAYGYTYDHPIGPIKETGSPTAVMKQFLESPGDLFPFPIEGCDSFTNGASCRLYAGPKVAGGVGDVLVTTRGTSFTFTVESDEYFDVRGSQITFSLTNKDGELYLHQKATARASNPIAYAAVKMGYSGVVWGDQAHKLRAMLDVSPTNPINWSSVNDWADLVAGNWGQFR